MKCFQLILFTLLYPISSLAYTQLSSYSYCGGDPVGCIDPTGEDIVILNYGNDLGHMHIAMLIQDDDGKWRYYSINGNNVVIPITGEHWGGREFNDVAVGTWDTPQDFFQSSYNVRDENSKYDKSKNHYGFSEGYQISTTQEQDAIMRSEFIERANTTYHLIDNNCATIVQRVMMEADIPVASPKYRTIHIPANIYLGEPEFNLPVLDINPVPFVAFKSIMKANPGGIYYHKLHVVRYV